MSDQVVVLVIDDNRNVRDAFNQIRSFLPEGVGLEVVGNVSDGLKSLGSPNRFIVVCDGFDGGWQKVWDKCDGKLPFCLYSANDYNELPEGVRFISKTDKTPVDKVLDYIEEANNSLQEGRPLVR